MYAYEKSPLLLPPLLLDLELLVRERQGVGRVGPETELGVGRRVGRGVGRRLGRRVGRGVGRRLGRRVGRRVGGGPGVSSVGNGVIGAGVPRLFPYVGANVLSVPASTRRNR